MTNDRTGGLINRGDHFLARVRIGKGKRISYRLACASEAAATARAEVMAKAAGDLLQARRDHEVPQFLKLLATAPNEKSVAVILKAVALQVAKGGAINPKAITFQQWGEKWTSGELARLHPDYVKAKSSASLDHGILKKHVYPHIGPIPVERVTLEDAERVMGEIPEGRSRANRRHVAQVMTRLMKMAVFPGKLIAHSPLPSTFLPKLGGGKAKSYLYPDDDARLLACEGVPFLFRLLYGFLAREGLRIDEALSLEWSQLDLKKGTIRLDENKTNSPRTWALSEGVKESLSVIKGGSGPFSGITEGHMAARFRADLKVAGVDRPELFGANKNRRPIRVHDLRGTFVTISLANDKTETWVADRTGHKSTIMISEYRQSARLVSELNLGPFQPLNVALGLADGVGSGWDLKTKKTTKRKGPAK